MELSSYFPIWDRLTPDQQRAISSAAVRREAGRGEIVHNGSVHCTGLLVIASGMLRAFILSDEGREITLYRLFERDICLLSASCMMPSMQLEVTIAAERDTVMWVIPPDVYKQVMQQSAPLANYTNELMASRLSDIMWLMEQVLWKSLDRRVAAFLLEESAIEDSDALAITHETIANHLGSSREVITRMLRYFQNEGMVALSRGALTLTDRDKLEALAAS